jgi:GNAT superfamily N-acetyltransferase
MRIVRWDPADADALRGCLEVRQSAHTRDDPLGSPKSARVLGGWLQRGYGGDPGEAWFVPGAAGGVIAWYRLSLPDLENQDRALVHPVVHPDHRRQGTGRELLRHAAGRAAAAGRVVMTGYAREESPGAAFAAWAGATRGQAEVRRVLDLRKMPAGQAAALRETAARAAAGYSLVTWTGPPTPDQYLEPLAGVVNAFADAPRDAGVQEEAWDGRRIRERGDAAAELMGVREYSVTAVHDATGEMAAMTQVAIDPGSPRWGHQALTAVTRAHRGHRLGLLVKAAMLEWLATAEPQIEQIETGNAASNKHMIAVNEALGFEVTPPAFHSYELGVADALDR